MGSTIPGDCSAPTIRRPGSGRSRSTSPAAGGGGRSAWSGSLRGSSRSRCDGDTDGNLDLLQALRKLPAGQREVIALHHLADLTVEQVADTLGLPTGTVKARLSRGRAALSTLLVKEGPHV